MPLIANSICRLNWPKYFYNYIAYYNSTIYLYTSNSWYCQRISTPISLQNGGQTLNICVELQCGTLTPNEIESIFYYFLIFNGLRLRQIHSIITGYLWLIHLEIKPEASKSCGKTVSGLTHSGRNILFVYFADAPSR